MCNISAPQLERLLEFCEIRPAVYEAEAHILHHQQAIYDLCQREKIAFLGSHAARPRVSAGPGISHA